MTYAITGVTGKVGAEVAQNLLTVGDSVRAVLRDVRKAGPWIERGCEIAVADMTDAAALGAAFTGVDGVFVLLPPNFDPSPGYPELNVILSALKSALLAARPSKVVCLSTVGAQASTENLLSTLGIMERTLAELPLPVAFLRPAWFMENSAWDIAPAMQTGIIPSFLQPLDRPIPMVAVRDIARVGAELLRETWHGRRVVELEGPQRVSPNDIAAAFTALLGKPVSVEAVPRETWLASFSAQGMNNPMPRVRMLDGFNEGWIDFEAGLAGSRKGATSLESVLEALLARDRPTP